MKNNLDLPDIRDLAPLSPADQACLDELRQTLARHGALRRFGVSLLHRHFEIAEDEILVESCDPTARTLALKVVKRDSLRDQRAIQTNWRLDRTDSEQDCTQTCTYDDDNQHIDTDHL